MADIDPKFLLMGWLTGRMIAGQVRQSQNQPQLPDGVLISSDGYILKDCNGLYLCAKKRAGGVSVQRSKVAENPGGAGACI